MTKLKWITTFERAGQHQWYSTYLTLRPSTTFFANETQNVNAIQAKIAKFNDSRGEIKKKYQQLYAIKKRRETDRQKNVVRTPEKKHGENGNDSKSQIQVKWLYSNWETKREKKKTICTQCIDGLYNVEHAANCNTTGSRYHIFNENLLSEPKLIFINVKTLFYSILFMNFRIYIL